MSSTFNKQNNEKCSSFAKNINKEITSYLSSKENAQNAYYQVMGYAIQQLHESKKIDFMCRSFVQYNLRKNFISNNKDKLPNADELLLYNRYSEYAKNIISVDFTAGNIMSIEGVSYKQLDTFASKMDAAAKMQKQDATNIQKTLHHIWLTKAANPRELFTTDIDNVIYNKKFFAKNDKDWSHVVWTNDKNLIPQSIKKLKKQGIEVRSIKDYENELKLFDSIIELTEKGKYGMASDILRLAILAKEGGVYADLNFRFEQSIKAYLSKYDFISGDFRNNFFAAKPAHIILEKALEKIQENLSNPPSYIKNHQGDATIVTTYYPFVLSILEHANEEENVDFYSDYYYAYGFSELDQGPIGTDNFGTSNTWKDEL